jgi:uncharacterized protein involved in tolerance to divalent cations
MDTPASYGVVLVTTGNIQEAETIANALVEAKLAACVSLLPIVVGSQAYLQWIFQQVKSKE